MSCSASMSWSDQQALSRAAPGRSHPPRIACKSTCSLAVPMPYGTISRPTASGTPDQRRRARTSAASGVNGTRRRSTGLSAAPIPTSMPTPRPREGSTTCRSITAPCSPPPYMQPCRQALRPWSRARWPGWLNEGPIKRFNVGAGRAPLPLIPVLEQKTIHDLLLVLDLAGAFVFAISGAMLGVRRNLDIFGILVLSFAASSAGGITRDLLIGAVPPAAISDWRYLAVALAAGLLTFFWYSLIARLRTAILIC